MDPRGDGWSRTTVGIIVKGSNGQNQIQLLGGDGRNSTDDVRADALLGYQLLTSKESRLRLLVWVLLYPITISSPMTLTV